MQVKKDEMRLNILKTAEDEFLKRGYENTSMRWIAQKAHTTQGNIYHYFPNKESLLEEILLPILQDIEEMVFWHIENEKAHPLTKELALQKLSELEEDFDLSEFRCLFDKRVVILLKLQSSPLLERKEKLLEALTGHLQEYFSVSDDAHYAQIVLELLVECLKHVLIEHENLDDAKDEFLKFFSLLFHGIISQIR